MSDFMQKQFEASQALYRLMLNDHNERIQMMEKYAEVQAEFAAQMAEKDRKIAKLEATIEALELLAGKK